MVDRKTKVLLTLIATALWVIALRPLVPVRNADAQTQQAPAPKKAHYELLEVEKGGTDGVYQLKDKVDELASKGWIAKSVAITDNATVILMEKVD